MPIFNFRLADSSSNFTNLGGQEYDDAVQATEVADALVKKVAKDEPHLIGGGWAVVVSDDDGEIYRAQIEPEQVH